MHFEFLGFRVFWTLHSTCPVSLLCTMAHESTGVCVCGGGAIHPRQVHFVVTVCLRLYGASVGDYVCDGAWTSQNQVLRERKDEGLKVFNFFFFITLLF